VFVFCLSGTLGAGCGSFPLFSPAEGEGDGECEEFFTLGRALFERGEGGSFDVRTAFSAEL